MRSRDGFIDVRGARLRFRVEGSGPNVVFVHGWALDLDMWRPQFEAFADSYRLIAFDRRGFGLSSGLPHIESDIDDLAQILAAVGAGRIAIVGMSQGARVALRWALRFPRVTACLVLDGPPRESGVDDGPMQAEIPMSAYRELVRTGGLNAFRELWRRHPFMQLRSGDARRQTLLREIVERYPGRDLQVIQPSLSPVIHLDRVAMPAIVINGECDTAERRAAGSELARRLPNARQSVVAGAGHLSNLDNPAAYNELLGDFFTLHLAGADNHHNVRASEDGTWGSAT
jgi:pimeloyl-ACP methyl ester carboxylesterase